MKAMNERRNLYEPKPGDRVQYRDDRPTDLRRIGQIAVVLPKIPLMGNQIWIRFDDQTEFCIDKGAVVPASGGEPGAGTNSKPTSIPVEKLDASTDE
jgi:hypothetical protein